ncbi:MAG: DNA replication/repair protein RecF [Bacillota bacterium]|nr:DNA replication/repair protein RecF [Bacillota bacterium]
MKINELSIENFRNYQQEQLTFDAEINIICGDNAQGKTNLLEAISYLSIASSFRAAADQELLGQGKDYFYLQGEIESRRDGQLSISAGMDAERQKRWRINGEVKKKLADIVGVFHTVSFIPDDINIVKAGPGLRRRYLNCQMSQLYPEYCQLLLRYNHLLKQRNADLRNQGENIDEAVLAEWDAQLIELGTAITLRRRDTLRRLQPLAAAIHEKLSGGEQLTLAYHSALCGRQGEDGGEDELTARFVAELARWRKSELQRGLTLIGPHRDDILIGVDGQPAREMASQGQQRTAALSLKLAELRLAAQIRGEEPVLLLDDVMSELDDKRRQHLLTQLGGQAQTFISGAGELGELRGRGKRWYVVKGRIEQPSP